MIFLLKECTQGRDCSIVRQELPGASCTYITWIKSEVLTKKYKKNWIFLKRTQCYVCIWTMFHRDERKFSNLKSALSRKEVKFNSDNILDLSFAPIKYIQSMKLLLKKLFQSNGFLLLLPLIFHLLIVEDDIRSPHLPSRNSDMIHSPKVFWIPL